MAYTLRDAKGIMRAKLDNAFAKSVMDNSKGFFREAKFTGRPRPVNVFELGEDFVVGSNTPMRVYFWKGETLIPED